MLSWLYAPAHGLITRKFTYDFCENYFFCIRYVALSCDCQRAVSTSVLLVHDFALLFPTIMYGLKTHLFVLFLVPFVLPSRILNLAQTKWALAFCFSSFLLCFFCIGRVLLR